MAAPYNVGVVIKDVDWLWSKDVADGKVEVGVQRVIAPPNSLEGTSHGKIINSCWKVWGAEPGKARRAIDRFLTKANAMRKVDRIKALVMAGEAPC